MGESPLGNSGDHVDPQDAGHHSGLGGVDGGTLELGAAFRKGDAVERAAGQIHAGEDCAEQFRPGEVYLIQGGLGELGRGKGCPGEVAADQAGLGQGTLGEIAVAQDAPVQRAGVQAAFPQVDALQLAFAKGTLPPETLFEGAPVKSAVLQNTVLERRAGKAAMGKPAGTYLTLESPALAVPDEEEQMRISEKIRDCISELLRKNFETKEGKEEEDLSILVVGLGNRNITPDALGPCVADHLNVTRHIIREYGKYAMGVEHAKLVSAIVPGVMGQTGMETTEIVRGIVRETRPDFVIAVDALAARNSRRLNRTIQIADTGIHPGSGVGNYRNGMTKESLGVPVIGIGVPTVVDAATIVNDTMENFIHALEESETLKSVGKTLRSYNQGEKYELVKELIAPHLNGMFVTPKDVDEMIHQISHTIAEALNLLCSHIMER